MDKQCSRGFNRAAALTFAIAFVIVAAVPPVGADMIRNDWQAQDDGSLLESTDLSSASREDFTERGGAAAYFDGRASGRPVDDNGLALNPNEHLPAAGQLNIDDYLFVQKGFFLIPEQPAGTVAGAASSPELSPFIVNDPWMPDWDGLNATTLRDALSPLFDLEDFRAQFFEFEDNRAKRRAEETITWSGRRTRAGDIITSYMSWTMRTVIGIISDPVWLTIVGVSFLSFVGLLDLLRRGRR